MSNAEFIIIVTCAIVGSIVIGVTALHILLDLWHTLCDWLRIKRFVWFYGKGSCITEQELEDMAFGESSRWWKHHEQEHIWCRFDDYRAGMLAASKALLRQRGIYVVKNKPVRKPAPPEGKQKGQQ